MKRRLPDTVIFILKDFRLPFLSELISETEAMGILVRTEASGSVTDLRIGSNDYIITDDIGGAELARKYKTGYSAFAVSETGYVGFWDAQCIIQGFDEIDADFLIKMYERARNIPWKIFETERTVVRELVLDDIDDMYKLYSEPGLSDFLPALCKDREEEVEFEKYYIRTMYGFYGYGIWTVLDKETGKFIGRAGITHRDGYDDLEVGYMLSNAYQHKGIAMEVMKAVIDYAKDKYGCEKLNAFIDDRNTSSIEFAKRIGFKKTGMVTAEERSLGWYVLKIQ